MEFDVEKVETLMLAMERHGMTRLSLKVAESELELERMPFAAPAASAVASPPSSHFPTLESPSLAPIPGDFICSPMVGTFYASPSPEAQVFVQIGDPVTEETVVCIIEAMKVMNEVKAGKKGVIKEIIVENGHPVEFGTKLFRIS